MSTARTRVRLSERSELVIDRDAGVTWTSESHERGARLTVFELSDDELELLRYALAAPEPDA